MSDDTCDGLLEKYRRDGFLIHDFGFDENLIAQCADVTKSYLGSKLRIQDLWRRNKAVKQLAAHPAVLKLLNELYTRRPFPFQTLNFPVGTQQATHSDTYFFNSTPERYMCGVWVALEDIDLENGPLHYYRGSHELPIRTRNEMK